MPSATPIHEDAALFERFLNGEDEAFVALFKRHNRRLFTYAAKILGSHEQAEDITQELWERVIQIRSSPQQIHNPAGFFVRMARNLCLDHLKRGRRTIRLDDADDSPHLGAAATELTEMEEIAVAALDGLPFESREVLVLNLYCGYRFDEIATMLGKSPDAVWARASRARAQLRNIVAAEMEGKGKGGRKNLLKRSTR
jgi:RNA polymerase sigma-70 factor (ECF subfamily)